METKKKPNTRVIRLARGIHSALGKPLFTAFPIIGITLSRTYMTDQSLITFFGTGDGQFKLSYTIIMGTSLILFSVTGFWLYYGPKRIMKGKRRTPQRAARKSNS